LKITFSPAKQLVVHEVVEMSRNDLLLERVTPAGNLPLYWCGGILFSFSSVPMTDDIVREYLDGTIHWLEVHFSRMEKHVPVITFESEEFKSTMSVKIIDTSTSPLHREFIKWLKDNIKEGRK
jgi:hypothetical protein